MARSLALNDLLAARCVWTFQGQVGEVVFHHRVANVVGAAVELMDFASIIATTIASGFITGVQHNTVDFRGAAADRLDPATGHVVEQAILATGGNLGTDTFTMAPSAAAVLVRKSTGIPGKKFRGRGYIPFLTSRLTNAGLWASVIVTAVDAVFGGTLGLFAQTTTVVGGSTVTTAGVILHRKPLPLTSTDVISSTVLNTPATQHRRGNFGKLNVTPF